MVDQLRGVFNIDLELLKVKFEEWGGAAPGPSFPNLGTLSLAAMTSLRSPEVRLPDFLDHIQEFFRAWCISEAQRLPFCGLEVWMELSRLVREQLWRCCNSSPLNL